MTHFSKQSEESIRFFDDPASNKRLLAGILDGSFEQVSIALRETLGKGDSIAIAVLRLLLDPEQTSDSITNIADRFGVKTSAVSQRKTRMLDVITYARNDPQIQADRLVTLFREAINRVGFENDLPSLVSALLGDYSSEERAMQTPTDRDLVRFALSLAIGPFVVVSQSTATPLGPEGMGRWFADRTLLSMEGGATPQEQLVDGLIRPLIAAGLRILDLPEFDRKLGELGVASVSLTSFRRLAERNTRRILCHVDKVLILSHDERKRAGRSVIGAIDAFGISRKTAEAVVATARGTNEQTVAADVRALTRRSPN